MINVPDRIKELLHQDSCKKNIRIHFPNGERSDICNDLIVADSVSFKESLCSRSELKFGLCEAPVFECEVVGVGNVKGATIEVYSEIYCEADVTDAVWQVDLQAYVYQIPYGVFVISESKRQADMIHRKIVAYGGQATYDWKIKGAETIKFTGADSYEPIVGYFLASNGIYMLDGLVDETSHAWSEDITLSQIIPYGEQEAGQLPPTLTIEIVGKIIKWTGYTSVANSYQDYTDLFRCEAETTATQGEVFNFIKTYLNNTSARDLEIQKYTDDLYIIAKNGRLVFGYNLGSDIYTNNVITTTDVGEYIYPYVNSFYNSTSSSGQCTYFRPTKFRLTSTEKLSVPSAWMNIGSEPLLYKQTFKSSYSSFGDIKMSFPVDGIRYYSPLVYAVDFSQTDIQAIAGAFIELSGKFGFFNRLGQLEPIMIKQQFELLPSTTLYPSNSLYPGSPTGGAIQPEDYQTCWYDDDYTVPYGVVKCTYRNADNESVEYISYLGEFSGVSPVDSYKTYDLENNEIIRNYTWTETQITSFCDSIADSLDGVTYMPVEFKGRGLPYVEAGDTFEILTASNDSITTIVLNRTITGEQHLVDSYKSV